jgi:thiamine biosynthesis lipoprotein ApbE
MRADALATACMVVGAEEALRLIQRAGNAQCYLIVAEGDSMRVVTSTGWEAQFKHE